MPTFEQNRPDELEDETAEGLSSQVDPAIIQQVNDTGEGPSGDDTVPSFNVPTGSEPSASSQPQRLRRYQPSFSEQANTAGGRKIDVSSNLKSQANPLGRARQAGTNKVGQVVRQQVAKLGGKIAARLGASVIGGPVAWAVSVGGTIKDAVTIGWKFLEEKWGTAVVLIAFIGLVLIIPLAILATIQSKSGTGPDLSGARAVEPLSDAYYAAIAAGDRGIITANSVESLKNIRQKMSNFLTRNPQDVDAATRAKAVDLFRQMDELEKTMRTSAYAANSSTMAGHVKSYQKLLLDLYTAFFPDAKDARERAVGTLNSGVIRSNEYCRGTANDIANGPLSPVLLNLIAELGKYAAANGFTITLSCAKTGHRGRTLHYYGRAVDIQVNPGDGTVERLMPFLFDNREKLRLAELIFNGKTGDTPPGYYNFDTSPPSQRYPIGDGHLTHIHLGVK